MDATRNTWWRRFGRWCRVHLRKMIRENASPRSTGFGFALGAFIGIYPTFGLGTPLSYLAASGLRLNRAAAVAGSLVMNPLTAVPFYSLSAWLGIEIVGGDAQGLEMMSLFESIRHYGWAVFLGSTVVAGISAALLGMALFFYLWKRAERRRARHHAQLRITPDKDESDGDAPGTEPPGDADSAEAVVGENGPKYHLYEVEGKIAEGSEKQLVATVEKRAS